MLVMVVMLNLRRFDESQNDHTISQIKVLIIYWGIADWLPGHGNPVTSEVVYQQGLCKKTHKNTSIWFTHSTNTGMATYFHRCDQLVGDNDMVMTWMGTVWKWSNMRSSSQRYRNLKSCPLSGLACSISSQCEMEPYSLSYCNMCRFLSIFKLNSCGSW